MPEFRIDVVIDPKTRPGARRVEGDLKRIEKRSNSVRSSMMRMLTLLGGGALITKSIRTIAQFEQTMSTVAAVTKATGAEFDALRQKAKDLGISTRFTATQAAEGLVELGRAGLSVQESLDAVGSSLVLAQAGSLGLAESADVTTTAIKVFGLEASDASDIADTLVIAANNAKTNVSEMGQAFTFAAANAADLDLSVQETAAGLAVLAEGGLRATRGGTALRAVLLGLAAPTKEAQGALQAAGLSLEDIDIKARGIVPVLQSLADAELDVTAKTAIFGKRFGAAASIMLKNIPLFEELEQKFIDLKGEAQRVADIMDDNLNGAMLRLKSAFEGLILEVGESGASGAFRGLFESLAGGLRSLAKEADKVIDTLEFLVILLGVRLAKQAIPAAIGALKQLWVTFRLSPVGVITSAIVIAGAALVAFGGDAKASADGLATLGDVAGVTWGVIKDGLATIQESFGALFAPLIESMNRDLATTNAGFLGFIRGIAKGIDFVAAHISAVWAGIVAVFDFKHLGATIVSGTTTAINNLLSGLEAFIDNVRAAFGGVFDFISKGFQNTFEIAKVYATIAANTLIGKFGEVNDAHFETIERLRREQDPANLSASILARQKQYQAEQTIPLLVNAYSEAGERTADAFSEAYERRFALQESAGVTARLDEFVALAEQRAQIVAEQREDASTLAEAQRVAAEAETAAAGATDAHTAAIERQAKAANKNTGIFAQYIDQLRAEQGLLGMTSRAREIANEVLQLENQLREEGLALTAAQREQAVVELERLQLLQVQAEILDEIRGPQEEFALQQQALNALFQDGKITIDEYNAALRTLSTQSQQTAGILGSTVQPGLETIGQQLFGIGKFTKETLGAVFSNLEDALVSFVQTGEFSFSQLVDSMLKDIARLLVQQGLQLLLGMLSGGIGGSAGGLISGLIGGGGGGGGGGPQYVGGGSYGGGGAIAPSLPAGGGGGGLSLGGGIDFGGGGGT